MAFKFNPLSGNFDMVAADSHIERLACQKAMALIQSIPTSNTNALGNTNFVYDPVTCKWVEQDPIPVTDENGTIIVGDDGT